MKKIYEKRTLNFGNLWRNSVTDLGLGPIGWSSTSNGMAQTPESDMQHLIHSKLYFIYDMHT